jgi:hypothetical protein
MAATVNPIRVGDRPIQPDCGPTSRVGKRGMWEGKTKEDSRRARPLLSLFHAIGEHCCN